MAYERQALSARHSLRWRLPVLISALIALVVLTFLWAAYRTVETTLMRAGGERAQGAADQVASLLDAQQAIAQLQRAATDAVLRDYLQSRTDASHEAALKRLNLLATSGPRTIGVWDDAGVRLLEISVPGAAAGGLVPRVLPPTPRPTESGMSALQASDGIVFSDMVAEIRAGNSPAEQTGASGRLGYLAVRSTFSVSPPGIIGRLVGQDAVVAVGNRTGDIWTDFSHLVHAPAVDLMHNGVAAYRAADGEMRLGAAAKILATPWVVWVEFPRARLVAPARAFMNQMVMMALMFVAAGAALASVVAARITRPLSELNSAAQAVAAGDYSPRIAAQRHDEIGRLGRAFNVMTDRVEDAQHRLEARVTERTAELAAARSEADRANRAKSEFLSLMSHDLRTPLNAILGFAQLLEIDQLNADQSEHVQQILHGGRHLLELISEVLDITRIETGQLSLSPETVSVRDVVHRAVELVKPLAAKRGIALHVRTIDESNAVHADRQRLSQILLNLLSNAVKYNRTGGDVAIGGERLTSDRYRITVTDTGPGIPASKIALLFHPFERLGAEQTAVEGTGLGLAISRALAEAMGGTLGVNSVIDQGSTFWVELPAAEHRSDRAPVLSSTPQATLAAAEPTKAGTVLYIEDNLSNVRLMERILQQRPGLALLHAPSGHAAFDLIRERHPDLVLLDMHLPDMSGEEVLHHLWADPASRSIPIVIVTADATPGLARRLKAAGATACITKPLNLKELLELVDTVLSERPKVGEI